MTPLACEVWNCREPTARACLAFDPPPRIPPIMVQGSELRDGALLVNKI
jgi:hypothetical protein